MASLVATIARVLGFEVKPRPESPESTALVEKAANNLQSVNSQSALTTWWLPIRESFAGAWQRNITLDTQTNLLAFSAVFACVTGIAGDIAKMRIKLSKDVDGIWTEITANQPWLPVLRKPNHYQTRIQFIVQWIISKLLYGNTYVLKERADKRGIVTALYVLDPRRVTVLVAEDGSVYYEIKKDPLSQVTKDVITLPASEVIHDMMVSLWHPLVGVSPIYACAHSGTMGNRIQNNSTVFFDNLSRPGGMLSGPNHIPKDTADRLKKEFEDNFSGVNIGRLAVAGDGLTYTPFSIPAETSQLIEQLRWTVEDVARAFHYPQYKLGGPLPPYASNLEALNLGYYTDCLQNLIESLELCLDEGLELPPGIGTELDLDNLMRMDTRALFEANSLMVGGGWGSPNEARFRANYGGVPGGESPMIQQQNYSLAALAKRDAQEDPFGTAKPEPPPNPPPDEPDGDEPEDEPDEKQIEYVLLKSRDEMRKATYV